MRRLSLWLLFVASCCFGDTNICAEDVWLEILKTNDLPHVANIMRSGHLTWPLLHILHGNAAAEDSPNKSRELSNALRVKIKEFENDKTVSVSESISVYSTLRKSLIDEYAHGLENSQLYRSGLQGTFN